VARIFGIEFITREDIVMAALDVLFIGVWIFLLGSFASDGAWLALIVFGVIGVSDIRFRWNRVENVWGRKVKI
jgi:hypothetical protein